MLETRCPTVSWFRTARSSWCPWRRTEKHRDLRFRKCVFKERCLIRAALALNARSLTVREWAKACFAYQLPQVHPFQRQFGAILFYAEMHVCEMEARERETGELVRREWTFMTNNQSMQRAISAEELHNRYCRKSLPGVI